MGGNLFQNSKRIPQTDYEKLIKVCAEKFNLIGRATLFPESFKSKIEHGDLDVIVCGPVVPKEELKQLFELRDEWISQNTSVISIFYNGEYQIDFCFHPEENFYSAYSYCRNGDASNLCGRLAHLMGLSLGHYGLGYYVNLSDCERVGFVSISRDWKKILEFLGLNFEEWKEGFEDCYKLYEWLVRSPYFNPEAYQFENLNHVNRIRNKKRPVFAEFVEWLKDKTFPAPKETKNKAEYLWNAVVFFKQPSLLGEIQEILTSSIRQKEANAAFNGETVMELAGVTGKEVGKLIVEFRKAFMVEEKESWINFRLTYNTKEIFRNWLTNRESVVS